MSNYDYLRDPEENRNRDRRENENAVEAMSLLRALRSSLNRASLERFTQISLRQIETELFRKIEETEWAGDQKKT